MCEILLATPRKTEKALNAEQRGAIGGLTPTLPLAVALVAFDFPLFDATLCSGFLAGRILLEAVFFLDPDFLDALLWALV